MNEGKPGSNFSGGIGRGRRPPSDNIERDLRRPLADPESFRQMAVNQFHLQSDVGNSNSNVLSGMSNLSVSSLNAAAPEFVPMGFQTGPVPDFQQAQLPDSSVISNLDMFTPQAMYYNHPVILEVNDLVVKLTLKPHKYEQVATQLTSILCYRVKDDSNLMSEVVSVIFEQGIGEPNFRFSGGRLCHHLSRNVTNGNPNFKGLLFKRCQGEFHCADHYMANDPNRLFGFTLFLADIFCHLLTPEGHHSIPLRSGLCLLLLKLLSHRNAETLKCVAQVLKCCGKFLDVEGHDEFDAIMSQLRDAAMISQVPPHIRNMLLSVVELRAANWGRNSEQSPLAGGPKGGTNGTTGGTVFYGPDGSVSRVQNDDSLTDSDESDTVYAGGIDDMDDEIAKDFEKFVLGQAN